MAGDHLVVAVTGASGAIYAQRLLEVLLSAGRYIHLTVSPAGGEVVRHEIGRSIDLNRFDITDLLGPGVQPDCSQRLKYYHYLDFRAGIASGSYLTGGMVICPCSMGTAGAIAHGLSQNLIHRAADVHLKENRKLVLVPRETPLGLVQLRNLTACAEAGAVILPAMPAFYNHPRTIEDGVDFIVGRICDHLGVPHALSQRWGVSEKLPMPPDGHAVER